MTTELNTQGPFATGKDALVNDLMIAASDVKEKVKEKLDVAGSNLNEARTVLTEKARTAVANSNDYVKHHPWKVLGVAAAAGVIVGILAWRR